MLELKGEIIALIVAVSWTATAIFAEISTKRLGTLVMNVVRMSMSIILLAALLFCVTGSPIPQHTDSSVWLWLGLSGLVGYVFGDFCLFKSYTLIGSRFGQLFMTLSSLFAAVTGYLMLSESISLKASLGMLVTITGISISVLSKGDNDSKLHLKLSPQGVLYGVGAAMGQGVGLVLSKMGMVAYSECLEGLDNVEDISMMMPFSGTLIRGIIGFVGFAVLLVSSGNVSALRKGIHDRYAMTFALLATVFGPFIGVSLSLLAVSYTSTGIAQTIMSITPVLILLPAFLIFKQKITTLEMLGAVISVVGVSLFF
ncbi:MAG: DMT family transporter [Bacteroidaceae bacterium]|nr:DMT family transporter [Bacteroidaceae bacterium]